MHGARAFADTTLDVFDGGHLAFHVFHHQVVIHLNRGFDELLVIALDVIHHISRHIDHFVVLWQT